MRRRSIARSLRLALLGLTLVLSALAGTGVAALYSARQRYEDRIARAYSLDAAASRLLAAGVAEEATLQAKHIPHAATERRRAREVFESALGQARALAADDGPSMASVEAADKRARAFRANPPSGSRPLVARPVISSLERRQSRRREEARAVASKDSRKALVVVIAFGVLAVLLALTLVSAILAAGRRPMEQLVIASRRLADGDLEARVDEDVPDDVAPASRAFNVMAVQLLAARDALDAERLRLAVTIESLNDALLVTDADGVIVTANPRAAELLPQAPIGARTADVQGLPDPAAALAGEVVSEHHQRTLSISAARLGPEGGGLVWTARDVTERARLERLKDEFVATASHELRSPLTSIKGFVELLHSSTGLSARQREFTDIILASTNRLVDLVDDLLDVARVEAGRVDIQRRPTDLDEMIREVAALLGPRLVQRDQDLELDLQRGLPLAMADPSRVRQVLTNLLTNAHQNTDEGGMVGVRATATSSAVVFEVFDTGHGMTAEQTEQVFERFYRTTDAPESGTGLGLAIVRSLVDLQGGTIDVVSTPGEGTTFTVSLPRAPESPSRKRPATPRRAAFALGDEDGPPPPNSRGAED